MVSPADEEGAKDGVDVHASASAASAAVQCTATAARPSGVTFGRTFSERQLMTRSVAASMSPFVTTAFGPFSSYVALLGQNFACGRPTYLPTSGPSAGRQDTYLPTYLWPQRGRWRPPIYLPTQELLHVKLGGSARCVGTPRLP